MLSRLSMGMAPLGVASAMAARKASLTTAGCADGHVHPMLERDQEGVVVPAVPYPDWYPNWDQREPPPGGKSRGPNRHIILVRHGQYVTRSNSITPWRHQQTTQ